MSKSFLDKYRKNKSELMESVLTKLNQEENRNKYAKDERFWKLTRNDKDIGDAVIRFLPDVHSDENWVKVIHYGFQGPTGRWYIENSLRTIGQDDPVNDANRKLYATGNQDDENEARKRGAKTTYISNILVVEDKMNPENEGKVFLYRYGKSIFQMIASAMKPEFDDEEEVFPFDPLEGANLNIRIFKTKKNNQFTYEKSQWLDTEPVAEDDDSIMEILNQTYDVTEFIGEDQFKPYDELARKFNEVWNGDDYRASNEFDEEDDDDEIDEETITEEEINKPAPAKKVATKATVSEDDDDDDFFN